jgi:hypothetical protein
MPWSIRLAALVAPLAAVLVVWLGVFLGVQALDGVTPPPGAAGHTLFFFLFFGAPVAYGLTALVAWPTYGALRRRRWRPHLGPIIIGAGLLGAVALPLVWALFWGSLERLGFLSSLGAVAGVAAGALFWFIGLRGAALLPPPAT